MYTTFILAALASFGMGISGAIQARGDENRGGFLTAALADPQALRSAAQSKQELQRALLGKWRTRREDQVVETLEFRSNGTLIRIQEAKELGDFYQKDLLQFDMIDQRTMKVTGIKDEDGNRISLKVTYSISGNKLTLEADREDANAKKSLGVAEEFERIDR
jgi:hypothetical protein